MKKIYLVLMISGGFFAFADTFSGAAGYFGNIFGVPALYQFNFVRDNAPPLIPEKLPVLFRSNDSAGELHEKHYSMKKLYEQIAAEKYVETMALGMNSR